MRSLILLTLLMPNLANALPMLILDEQLFDQRTQGFQVVTEDFEGFFGFYNSLVTSAGNLYSDEMVIHDGGWPSCVGKCVEYLFAAADDATFTGFNDFVYWGFHLDLSAAGLNVTAKGGSGVASFVVGGQQELTSLFLGFFDPLGLESVSGTKFAATTCYTEDPDVNDCVDFGIAAIDTLKAASLPTRVSEPSSLPMTLAGVSLLALLKILRTRTTLGRFLSSKGSSAGEAPVELQIA